VRELSVKRSLEKSPFPPPALFTVPVSSIMVQFSYNDQTSEVCLFFLPERRNGLRSILSSSTVEKSREDQCGEDGPRSSHYWGFRASFPANVRGVETFFSPAALVTYFRKPFFMISSHRSVCEDLAPDRTLRVEICQPQSSAPHRPILTTESESNLRDPTAALPSRLTRYSHKHPVLYRTSFLFWPVVAPGVSCSLVGASEGREVRYRTPRPAAGTCS